ncbi:MAG TPA: aminotransferase class V-fold PLP-dependent enzyme, partial [Chthonomonadaceae bacterium]|nr:aminotransferase class V-fold PLP-dependent enzyme [Chthonomonadaceae bacterium]
MGIYEVLGIRPIINAHATLTRLGGSQMPPEVVAAMAEASRCFVDLEELQQRAGERIAALTHNEAAYICSGAAAGLTIATAACITGDDPRAITQLPDLTGLKDEVIIHRSHRNGYDHAVRQVGIHVVEIGRSAGTTRQDLERAISPRTAAIVWFQGAMTGQGDLPLSEVIAVGSTNQIPVIVDAAAQLPPVHNLWRFTQMGAALAVFSGGKDLRGPQSSGLILGQRALIECCRLNGNPHHSIGRPMKVGKEEMIGLLAAVQRYLDLDHEARERWCEEVVAGWNEALNRLPGVSACRDFPNEAGQPLPRCLVTVEADKAGIHRDGVLTQLAEGNPGIAAASWGADAFYLNPMTLELGEEQIVLERLLEIFGS